MHINNITEKINGELENYVRSGLKLHFCEDGNFNIYVFSIVLEEETLNNHWENIQNKVALDFQSNLEKEIELWNLYIIFFIEKEIAQKDLKYKIENDHYCARKIVLDNIGNIKDDEEKINSEISKKLFDLEISVQTTTRNLADLEREISEVDSRLISLDQINTLIKQYKD